MSFMAGVVGAGFPVSSTTRATAKEMPDAAKCMADVNAKGNAFLEKQNAAADRAHEWADKGDAYVTILTRVKVGTNHQKQGKRDETGGRSRERGM